MSPYTLRFRLYAKAHGKNPDEIPCDQAANAAFLAWLDARFAQWRILTAGQMVDMDAFDAWLEEWVGSGPEREPATVQAELFAGDLA